MCLAPADRAGAACLGSSTKCRDGLLAFRSETVGHIWREGLFRIAPRSRIDLRLRKNGYFRLRVLKKTVIVEQVISHLRQFMARPLSPEKRSALLESATQAVAELGVQASTASIARGAGVAEGTLFTYFESKEALFQELYLHLKRGLADAVMPDYPTGADYMQRMQHVFERYVNWGLANPSARFAVARLAGSGQISDDTRSQGIERFLAVAQMMQDGVRDGVLVDAPISFLSSLIEHIADTTIEHIERHPKDAALQRKLGFRVLWRAITM
jgi:AcrR family transcriptional regulator